ncbi:high light inducible protein [Prochlorococcus marinus]|uniref:high light inducible protein n=1 Tax=Prochlorococcus marinus TaxID=1219 RepID=UPI0022B3D8A8|nr:high light inducible protein [Prochlorococcus marinus]
MNSGPTKKEKKNSIAPVSKQELNSWKRGFTPQAEIWNGRMATVGLLLGLFVLILINSFIVGK